MKIRAETRRRAFYERFHWIAGHGDQVELSQLEAAWASSGLRRCDLHNTLRELVADHLVMLGQLATRPCVRLTRAGVVDAERLRHALFARLRDWWILVRVGAGPATTTGSPPPRRRSQEQVRTAVV